MQWIQLLIALSLLVVIHELGHFTFARIFHVRVEKFYMFFNPRISLIRAKKFGGRWHIRFLAPNVEPSAIAMVDEQTGEPIKDAKGHPRYRPMTDQELLDLPEDDWRRYPDHTEWGIGWVPFGGYCAIAGMIDETKSATDLPSDPQPWEYRSRKVWQRLLITIGGILVNFVAGLIIYMGIIRHWGTDELPLSHITSGLYYSDILRGEGFYQQDRILTIDGIEPTDLAEVTQYLIIEGKRDVVVLRGSDTVHLEMSDDLGQRYLALTNDIQRQEQRRARADKTYQKQSHPLVTYYMPFVIDSVLDGTAASYAALQRGDSIIGVNDSLNLCYTEVQEILRQHPCDSVYITFWRHGQLQTTGLFLGDQCLLGVYARPLSDFYAFDHTDYSLGQAIPEGIRYGWQVLTMYIKQFRLVFSKEGAQSLGGFGAIGSMFPKQWSWYGFWSITAFLSIVLAFMNFLPIPALDGGYILFLIFELITGKQPGDKFLERANNVGFWLLMALLLFANGNDIVRFFF